MVAPLRDERKLLFVTPTEETAEGLAATKEFGDRAAMESSRLPSSRYTDSAEAREGDSGVRVAVKVVGAPPLRETGETSSRFLDSSEL